MPLKLDQISKDAAAQSAAKYTPKFFDKALTGCGKKQGVLSNMADPARAPIPRNSWYTDSAPRYYKHKMGASFTVTDIPLDPLSLDCRNVMISTHASATLDPDDYPAQTFQIGTATAEPYGADVYLRLLPFSLQFENENLDTGGTRKKLSAAYVVEVLVKPMSHSSYTAPLLSTHRGAFWYRAGATTPQDHTAPAINWYVTSDPADTVYQIYRNLATSNIATDTSSMPKATEVVDRDQLDSWFENYSLYDAVCEMARFWNENVAEHVSNAVRAIASAPSVDANMLAALSEALGSYDVPLDQYATIYRTMEREFSPEVVRDTCSHNINLLMNITLDALSQVKDQLPRVVPPNGKQIKIDKKFSREQRAAISTDEPLALAQAAAGTGKTTSIRGRLGYMNVCGVDPQDVTVLSFTNAAADHVKEIAPNVNSMTIASMINSIYAESHPTHMLSTESTLANTLDLKYDPTSHAFLRTFGKKLRDLSKSDDSAALISMANYIDNHFDEVITWLDRVGQTTLNLEIIITYLRLTDMPVPASVACKHVIIDEVQDNSVFEFIFALKYACEMKTSLYLVGDCSQTLYEFRASNPRALNALEASGVFATFKLQTNYRSNQAILDFANVMLDDIDANRYAKLRLQANSLAPVTSSILAHNVRLMHAPVSRKADIEQIMENRFRDTIMPYIEERNAADEQVCFLCFTRRHAAKFQELVEKYMPSAKCVSLMGDKTYNCDVISHYCSRYASDLKIAPGISTDPIRVASNCIMGGISAFVNNKQMQYVMSRVRSILGEWATNSASDISRWVGALANGSISFEVYFDKIVQSLLDAEIRYNAVKQSITSQRNAQRKLDADIDSAQVLIANIHSAKGLEFDNTVVLHIADASSVAEDQKRMYYVAATRAKNTELFLAFTIRTNNSVLLDGYDAMMSALLDAEGVPRTDDEKLHLAMDVYAPAMPDPADAGDDA